MLFTAPIFLFAFLPCLLLLYYFSPAITRNVVLIFASLFFYAWGETQWVLLILLSSLANYGFARAIDRYRDKSAKKWLVAGISFNLGILATFKYANFFVDNLNWLLNGIDITPVHLDPVHLPLGISFFSFQAMSYIIDVFRNDTPAQRKISHVVLYISLFPQLIAGPIVRYKDIARDMSQRRVDIDLFVSGVLRFSMGLAKKMLIANPLGQIALYAFATPEPQLSLAFAWLGIVCYALQIYFDFSGYSDMAIGLGRMFGFRFLENFNYPYIARSLQDFWRRWHISLSGWFRDYLYIPLGGNRAGPVRTYFNLFIVFFLCGLWHGASWNFVIWGGIHGCFLILERAGLARLLQRLPAIAQHTYTLLVVCVAWVFFRAEELPDAIAYLATMFGMGINTGGWEEAARMALQPDISLAILGGIALATPIYRWLLNRSGLALGAQKTNTQSILQLGQIAALLLLSMLAIVSTTYNPFIYFRF